jgi:hypothetical protein
MQQVRVRLWLTLAIVGLTVWAMVMPAAPAVAQPGPQALVQTVPQYELHYIPTREIACSFSSLCTVSGMQVKEYVFYQLAPPPTPRQQLSPMTLNNNPAPGTGFSQGGEKWPLVFSREVFGTLQNTVSVGYELVFQGQICRTELDPVRPGQLRRLVADLTPAQRKSYTAADDVFDYNSPVVSGWLDSAGLRKTSAESELDFGKRVFLAMAQTFHYGGTANTASTVVTAKGGVCAGLSIAFCAAMRASGVPCRVRNVMQIGLGGNYGGSEKGHATDEFFCSGIGWVPVDLTPGCSLQGGPDDVEALQWFGQDRADNLMIFNGASDFSVNTVHFGSTLPEPSGDFRKQYQNQVTNPSTSFWGLMYTGNGTNAQYTNNDSFYARVWTIPSAYEKASPASGPAASAANVAGFSVWRDTSGWHIRGTTDGKSHVFQMSVYPEMANYQGQNFSPGQSEQALLAVGYPAMTTSVQQDLPTSPAGTGALRFLLTMDGRDLPSLVYIGSQGKHPTTQPFTMAVQ